MPFVVAGADDRFSWKPDWQLLKQKPWNADAIVSRLSLMQQPPSKLSHKWQLVIAKVPAPIRLLLAAWVLISLAFDLGLPSSVRNIPPIMRFIVLLPMALLSAGLGILILWQGGQTLYRTSLVAFRSGQTLDKDSRTFRFMGGIGALNIFMVVYYSIAFSLAKALGTYVLSVVISGLLAAAMIFVLFRRGRPPRDVKIFLWGGSIVTIVFGLVMATVAVPLAS